MRNTRWKVRYPEDNWQTISASSADEAAALFAEQEDKDAQENARDYRTVIVLGPDGRVIRFDVELIEDDDGERLYHPYRIKGRV